MGWLDDWIRDMAVTISLLCVLGILLIIMFFITSIPAPTLSFVGQGGTLLALMVGFHFDNKRLKARKERRT
jgi:ABC-type phosphate transport system auxiliary subunit